MFPQQSYQNDTFYLIILYLAPLLSTLVSSFFYAITGRPIPPVLPQVNGHSFGQALLTLVVILLVGSSPSASVVGLQNEGRLAIVVLIFMFLMIPLQNFLEIHQERITQKRIVSILEGKATKGVPRDDNKRTEEVSIKIEFRENVTLSHVKELAYSLVDVDFIPNSLVNWASGFPREIRRDQLVQLINENLSVSSNLESSDFLVPEEERRIWNYVYSGMSVVSFGLYLVSIYLFSTLT